MAADGDHPRKRLTEGSKGCLSPAKIEGGLERSGRKEGEGHEKKKKGVRDAVLSQTKKYVSGGSRRLWAHTSNGKVRI